MVHRSHSAWSPTRPLEHFARGSGSVLRLGTKKVGCSQRASDHMHLRENLQVTYGFSSQIYSKVDCPAFLPFQFWDHQWQSTQTSLLRLRTGIASGQQSYSVAWHSMAIRTVDLCVCVCRSQSFMTIPQNATEKERICLESEHPKISSFQTSFSQ